MNLAIVLLVLAACGGDEKAAPRRTAVTTEEEAKAPAAEQTPQGPTGGRALAAAQRHAEAVPELEKLLAENPTEEALFLLLRLEAIAAEKQAEVLDRLDANTAIGDRVRDHFRLRAELALAAGRPSDALEAARKVAQANPEEGAVLIVRAVRAGAPAPTLDPTNAADALVSAALQDPKKGAPALAALSLSTWQARALRADTLRAAGDNAAAVAELDAVLAAGDAESLITLAPRFAELSPDAALAGRHLAAAAKAADALSAGAEATRLTSLAVPLLLRTGQTDASAELCTTVLASRQAVQDALGGAEVGLRLAQTQFRQGFVAKALAGATAASTAAQQAGSAGLASEAAWTQGLAAALLGDADAVGDAAGRADAKAAPILQSVRAGLVGDTKTDRGALANFDATDAAGLRLQLAAARLGFPNAEGHLARAAKLADTLGDTAARIDARLELERLARSAGNSTDGPIRELQAIAEGLGPAGAPLRAEIAARLSMAGKVGQLDAGADLGAAVANWAPLVGHDDLLRLREKGLLTDDPSALPDGALARIAVGRAQLRAKNIDAALHAFQAGLAALPNYNEGRWAPASVLYGGAGAGIEQDLASLQGADGQAAAELAMLLQDWLRGARNMREAQSIGDDPSLALGQEERLAFNDAQLKLRADALAWLAGYGAAPDASAAALDELTKKAMESKGFARALPAPLPDLAAMAAGLQGTAVLSFRIDGSQGEAVVLTDKGGRVLALKDPKKLEAAARDLSRALRAGVAQGGTPVSPKAGDALRRQLVDVFFEDLRGVGRYVVVPDGSLRDFPLSVFPEQQEGLRFLADIRAISSAVGLGELLRPAPHRADKFSPDYLGIAGTSVRPGSGDEVRLANEIENVGRLFTPEGRVLLAGADAKLATIKEKMAGARFIHLMDVEEGERGAIRIGSETLSLAEVRGLDLSTKIVILSGEAGTTTRMRWVQAFQSAGAETVLSTAWTVEAGAQATFLNRFFDAILQERTPTRALSDSRSSSMNSDDDAGTSHFDPSWWGQYVLYGMP